MQDLQPIVDWQEDVADMLVSTHPSSVFCLHLVVLCKLNLFCLLFCHLQ